MTPPRLPLPAALLLAGCTTTATRLDVPAGIARPRPPATGGFYAGVIPLGSVPYDNRSLPAVSADGLFVATQAGPTPAWEVLLAASGAPVPASTRIEIHRLDRERAETTFQSEVGAGLLLGRGGDDGGFLVESVEADGSRRIGYASWTSAAVQWLVDDDHVNAFAGLGAGGRLAWSRRERTAEHFDLVIRRGGEEWTLGAQGGDWLMPSWSAQPDGLFAFRLLEAKLEAVFMSAESPQATRDTMVRLPLGTGLSRHDAYQCAASFAASPGPQEPYLLFWHPRADRIGFWRPLASPAAAVLLEPGSMAAAIVERGYLLVATDEWLSLADPGDLGDRRPLLRGACVPRRVAIEDWPYVILSPAGDRIDLMALRLLRQ